MSGRPALASLASIHIYPPMSRFRLSVVVAGFAPWAEDGWRRIRIGAVSFRVVKPCGRCVVTTIDQSSLANVPVPSAGPGRR
jgi:uncharacterized protein YcbX